MPRAKADPELVAAAHELRAVGCPLREIAETLGVTAPTIKRWLDEPRPPPASSEPAAVAVAPALPAHMAPPPPAAPAVEVGDDMVVLLQAMLQRTLQRSANSEASGNFTSAQREGRDAAALATVLARTKNESDANADTLRISRADVAKIEESLRERIAAICNRPLLCSACSRALSVQWGIGSLEAAKAAEQDAANVIDKAR